MSTLVNYLQFSMKRQSILFQFNYTLILLRLSAIKPRNWNVCFVNYVKQIEQCRQCTCNFILRRFCATIVAVEKQWVLHNLSVCICSLRYPACNAHAPWSVACPALQYVSTFSHKRHNFRKSYWRYNICFEFLCKFVWNIFHSKKRWARYDKDVYCRHVK